MAINIPTACHDRIITPSREEYGILSEIESCPGTGEQNTGGGLEGMIKNPMKILGDTKCVVTSINANYNVTSNVVEARSSKRFETLQASSSSNLINKEA